METRPRLQAQRRTVLGKQVRRLRKAGILPANVYGYDRQPQAIQIEAHRAWDVLRGAGNTQLIDLVIDNGPPQPVLLRGTTVDAARNSVIHVEFYRPNLRQSLTSTMPLHFVGDSPAVKSGGIFLPVLDHVQIESLPTDVPGGGIEVDISGLAEFNDSLTVADIPVPAGVTVLTPGDEVIAKVNPPTREEVVEEFIAETVPLPNELGGNQAPADSVPEA